LRRSHAGRQGIRFCNSWSEDNEQDMGRSSSEKDKATV
jgi:hypothetical protein